jgi:phospholipid transport system substrate-binding protein
MMGKFSATVLTAHAIGERLSRISLVACGLVLSAMIAATPALPARAAAEAPAHPMATPAQVVDAFYATLLRAMKDGTDLGYQGRYDALAPTMSRAFDFTTMTRIAIGPRWGTLQPAQQDSLVAAFRRFSIASYASEFDQYSGQKFEIVKAEEPAPQGVIVSTVMQQASGKPIKFNYLLHRTASGWRIVDIYLEGTISQLAVRRSEFTSILSRSGPDALADDLNEKVKRLAMM